MSHFKLLVIGENIEEQLAPYDENLVAEAYKDDSYDHAEKVQLARKFYTGHPEYTPSGLDLQNERALIEAYCEGEDIRWTTNEAGEEISEQWSTYNPKSKWDYWVIGGRYNAGFKILPGTPDDHFKPSEPHWSEEFGNTPDHINAADQARKSAIDWQAMKDKAAREAEELWAKLETATEGMTPPDLSWEQTRQKHGEDIDAARHEWNTHPWNIAARATRVWEAYDFFKISEPDPRAAFLAHQELMATTGFYAILNKGEWISQGRMGWFGFSDDTVSEEDWRTKVKEFIDELPEDAVLTIVDCHI